MNEKLSERLAAAVERLCEDGMDTRGIVELFRESEALARRVEGAAVRNVVGQQWDDVFAREGNVVWCSDLNPGQRVRLVPEVGS